MIWLYPYQMVLQTVFRMGPSLIFGHSQIIPEIAPLRQVPPSSVSKGGHSSPGLKACGFLASFIKNSLKTLDHPLRYLQTLILKKGLALLLYQLNQLIPPFLKFLATVISTWSARFPLFCENTLLNPTTDNTS